MDANPFADLIPAKNPFADLIPVKGSNFDDRFKGDRPAPKLSDAVTDIPAEIGRAGSEAYKNITGVANRGQQGPIEGLLNTGRAVMGIPQMLLAPVTGAARSLIGHPMAQAEHAVGTLINPEVAAKDDPQKMYEAARGDVDLAMSAAGSRKPSLAAPVKVVPPTIQELKTAAKADYQSPEVVGLEVKPTSIKSYSDTAKTILNNEGFDENVAPKTFGILDKLQSIPPHATVSGQNFNSLRKMLGKAAGSIEPSEKAAASMAIDHLDSFIPAIPASDVIAGDVGAAAGKLEQARGNYSAAKQAEKIDNKTVQAEVRAAAANSGMNVANTVRQRMADVVLKPKEQRGLLPDEIAAAKQISEGTKTQNVLRAAGNILGGGGGLGTAIVGTIGGVATGGPGAALPLAGFALKALSNKMTLRQAERLSEMIRSRAPLASSSAKFNQAATQLQAKRTPQAVAGIVLAARNLSMNLRSAGLNFSPSDLIGGLMQAPATSNAQQDQMPRPPGQ